MRNKTIVIVLLGCFVLGNLLALYYRESSHKRGGEISEFHNPLFDKYQELAEQHHLDVSGMEMVLRGRKTKLTQLPFYQQPAKSYDVLVLGDSSVRWGVIPQIVEQVSGLKVGVLAFEGLRVEDEAVSMFRTFANHYLKDDGLVLFGFIEPTLSGRVYGKQHHYQDWFKKISLMSKDEFASYVQSRGGPSAEGFVDAERKKVEFTGLSFSSYQAGYQELVGQLKYKLHLRLPDLQFYIGGIEPVLNPEWNHLKTSTRYKDQISWDNRSLTIYKGQVEKFSKPSAVPTATDFKGSKDYQSVAKLLRSLPFHKAFLLHLSTEDNYYAKMRALYQAYYQADDQEPVELIDLGKRHPASLQLPMESTTHMMNETGFYASLWLGEWLLARADGAKKSR